MPCRLKMKTRTKHLRREIQRGDVFMKTEIEGGFVGHRRRDSIVRMLGREDLSESLLLRGRGGRELELCVVGHHTLETDTNTLNDTQEDGTHNGRVTGGLDTTTDSQGTTSEETSDNAVPRVLGLADTLDGAIECREQATPNAKVTTEHRSASLDGSQGAYPALTVGAVTEALDTVPNSTTNSTHAESTTEIAQGDPWARIARVIHNM
jgi:hypothetical protein